MRQRKLRKTARTAPPAWQADSADIAGALENGLIFITLLIALCTALFILNGQIIRLV